MSTLGWGGIDSRERLLIIELISQPNILLPNSLTQMDFLGNNINNGTYISPATSPCRVIGWNTSPHWLEQCCVAWFELLSLFPRLQDQGSEGAQDVFSAHAQNAQLGVLVEVFAEFDKRFIGLESMTAPL